MTMVKENQVALKLADLRRASGKTQAEVAGAMGVGQARVSQIERDYPHLGLPTFQRYMEALGGDVSVRVGDVTTGLDSVVADAGRTEARERNAAATLRAIARNVRKL